METKLIEQYKTKRLELEQAEDEMNDHFERIVDSMLKTSKTESDFIEIKERLRVMPESAGLCDNCKVPKMINTGGDGVHEPAYEELYCKKKEMVIEPQPPEDQVKKCDGFEPCS